MDDRNLTAIRHGGRVFQVARELGLPLDAILDFSASINPLGMPPEVAAAAREALALSIHYPEAEAVSLVAELADFHDLPAGSLVAGNGSTELIYLLLRSLRPNRVLLVEPAFAEYARAAQLAGAEIGTVRLDPANDFRFAVEPVLAAVDSSTEMVVLANPGNPHGGVIPRTELLSLADQLPAPVRLVVDEAFIDFCPEHSLVDAVAERDNLLVLRSLTKFYAIPGLRAGYLAGPEADARALAASREPWSMNSPAIAAAKACLGADAFRRESLERIPGWRRQLADGLAALGLKVFPAAANYLLGRLPGKSMTATSVERTLCQQGILVRDCSNFEPLDDRYLRLAVRTVEENLKLLRALKGVLL